MYVGTKQQMEILERKECGDTISGDESVENVSSPPSKKCKQCTYKLHTCVCIYACMYVI